MQGVMIELMQLCGFDFQAATFPELFQFLFLAMSGTAILCSIIKVMFYITFNSRKIGR